MKYEKAFEELKKIARGRYCSLEYRKTGNKASGKEETNIRAYTNDYGWTQEHSTFRQVLDEVAGLKQPEDHQITDGEKIHVSVETVDTATQ